MSETETKEETLLNNILWLCDTYERELGPRSSGLAFIHDRREKVIKRIVKETEYYKWLEKRVQNLSKENIELREAISMPMPKLESNMQIDYNLMTETKYFIWCLKMPMIFRIPLKDNWKKDHDFWKQVRWISYRSFCKMLRSQFDENFKRFQVEATKYK